MTFQTLHIGKKGEELAIKHLLTYRYTVKDRNFRTRFGEIDIVAEKDCTIYFVEVKTRVGISKGKPYEAVTRRKLQHLKNASELYVLKNKLKNYKLSLMVISIVLKKDLTIESIKSFDIGE